MRSEKEMFDLILGIAKEDERIRAVYMNGSRTNPNVAKDIFQDYDIVYVVTETTSFLEDPDWIHKFGRILMMQEPDKLDQFLGKEVNVDDSYTYLMLFNDGNRIDLHIETKSSMRKSYVADRLTIPLLDKDYCLPDIPAPSDVDYHVQKPTEGQFISCTNEFWWCLQNVAKGIWRDQLPYAKNMFYRTTHAMLDKMIGWWIGMLHDYQVSVGAMNKYFKTYLPRDYWEMYEKTYADSDYDHMWDSIFVACELFRTLGRDVAENLNIIYPEQDDQNMTEYLKQVRYLPSDAQGIF